MEPEKKEVQWGNIFEKIKAQEEKEAKEKEAKEKEAKEKEAKEKEADALNGFSGKKSSKMEHSTVVEEMNYSKETTKITVI